MWFVETMKLKLNWKYDYSTRLNAVITQDHHFDIGVVQHSLSLHTKGYKNYFGQNMRRVSGPLIWNGIPESIQKSTSIHSFKANLKKHFLGVFVENNSNNNNDNNNNNNRTRFNHVNNRRARNNNHGQLTEENRQNRVFQSRWDEGRGNLI